MSGELVADPVGLIPKMYDEFHTLAEGVMRRERAGHDLRPSDLVHEAYLRLSVSGLRWEGRRRFRNLVAGVMRHALVDHVRDELRQKRGGSVHVVPVDDGLLIDRKLSSEMRLELHDLVSRLAIVSPRQGRLVRLRLFEGLDLDEASRCLGISRRTAHREWAQAKTWLTRAAAFDGVAAGRNGLRVSGGAG